MDHTEEMELFLSAHWVHMYSAWVFHNQMLVHCVYKSLFCFDIGHSVAVKSQADHCQLKFPSFEISSIFISKEQRTVCHYWGYV